MGPVCLHLCVRVSRERRADFLAFLREATPYYEAPGGIRIRLLERADDPEELIEVVEYASRADYERDQHRVEHDPEMQSYLRRWRELLMEPPRVIVWDEHSVR
jgi:hypothetical protein